MIELHQGDCLDIMPELDEGSVDTIITDPPYGLEFMGIVIYNPGYGSIGDRGYPGAKGEGTNSAGKDGRIRRRGDADETWVGSTSLAHPG